MAKALSTGADSPILRLHPKLDFQSGPYAYEIVRQGQESTYTVSRGEKEKISAPILWAFGHGQMGQTFVFAHNGTFYESRVSFYSRTKKLDFTLGAPATVPASLIEAAGREMTAADIKECFGCHSTASLTSDAQIKLEQLTTGVRCEACHGPGEKHVAAMEAGRPAGLDIASLKKMSAEDTSNFCGACHRTWDQVMLLPGRGGIGNVRFQPYRLTNSPCYDTEDRRISCTACHNPHEELKRDAVSYDAKCTACHAPAKAAGDGSHIVKTEGKTYRPCPVAKQSCVTCHMPKVEVPGAHFGFTDHHIRIVRTGRPGPI
jgi:Zn finger protein HypA/HybF involved in hydrogenase expression